MLKNILLSICLSLFATVAFAQIDFSYLGHLGTHPGAKIGIQVPYKKTNIEKQRKRRVKIKYKEKLLTLDAGFYHLPNTHTGTFIQAGWGYRRTKQRGFKLETFFNTGYWKVYNAGTTFEVSNNGFVSEVERAARGYWLLGWSWGFGRDLSIYKDRPFAWHIRPGISLQLPYNTTVNVLPMLEAGVTVYFRKNRFRR